MPNPQVADYIKKAKESGMDVESIKTALIQSGWPQQIIDEEFAALDQAPPVIPPTITPAQETPQPMRPQPIEIQQTQFQPTFQEPVAQPRSRKKLFASIVSVLIITALAGGAAYAYVMRIGPFARAPYTEQNFVSGLLASFSKIDTSSYKASAGLTINPRAQDAAPFAIDTLKNPAYEKQYQSDVTRVKNISAIVDALESYTYNSPGGTYPATLAALKTAKQTNPYYQASNLVITDPKTGTPYQYMPRNNGTEYSLSFSLETHDALSQLKNSYYTRSGSIKTSGNTVTVSQDAFYIYIAQEPPKPFLVELSDSLENIPPDVHGTVSASATTDWRAQNADWKFNFDATGDFGDLAYKINADALKKADTLYFRINNLPSLFLLFMGDIGDIKGTWYKVDTKSASSSNPYSDNILESIANEAPTMEQTYKENRKELTQIILKAAEIADQEHLLVFKSSPHHETIDGKSVYAYQLGIRRDAIVPYYEKLLAEINTLNTKGDFSAVADEAYLEYLKSDEFKTLFDYYDKNTTLTAWVDDQGFLAKIAYTLRVIPQDSAKQLSGKQIDVSFELSISDINKNVDIKAPQDAKDISSINGSGGPLGEARIKARDARRIADIRQIQLALELYADANNQEYPTQLSGLAPKYISTIPKDPTDQSSYAYSYSTVKGKRTLYHIGASLEDAENNALNGDEDSTSGFNGTDAKGCNGEINRYCYDVTP